jgi:hypothetical protein
MPNRSINRQSARTCFGSVSNLLFGSGVSSGCGFCSLIHWVPVSWFDSQSAGVGIAPPPPDWLSGVPLAALPARFGYGFRSGSI